MKPPTHTLAQIKAMHPPPPEPEDLRDATRQWLSWLQAKRAAPDGIIGISTGLRPLDIALGGLESGKAYCVAARPGCGKTAMGAQWARNAAERGHRVTFCTLEQPSHEIAGRMILSQLGKSTRQIMGERTLDPRIMDAAKHVSELPIRLIQKPSKWDVLREAIRAEAEAGSKIAIIDYIQLLDRGSGFMRNETIGIITAELKELAKDAGIPIVVLAQINRSGKDDPTMGNLKDSGDIEQDMDAVIILHRHPKDPNEPGRGLSDNGEIRIVKNRQGDTGAWDAVFHGPTFTWTME